MSSVRIASRYAKALIDLSETQKSTDQVYNDMKNFQLICRENKEFTGMLRSPLITPSKKEQILKEIFKGRVTDLTLSFFSIVAKKNREKFLPETADVFIKYYHQRKGLEEVTVTTAVPLTKDLKAEFEKTVTALTGKKPLLAEKVSSEIIGGFILKLDDRQLDESISGQLRSIKLRFHKENK